MIMILAFVGMRGTWHELRVHNLYGQIGRGFLFLVSSVTIVIAVSVLPLPVFTALVFSSPIFIALFSGPILAERVGLARWVAIFVGFTGVLVVVRPGGAGFDWLLLWALAGAATSGLRDIATRWLARTETSLSILFWSNIMVMLAAALSVPWRMAPVTIESAFWYVLLGFCNLMAHLLTIHALRIADAALVGPYKYTGLIWATIIGFLVWRYLPDLWTIVGACIIATSGIAMARAERVKAN
jgi:drug/metabolite transporter (DMT)-like permease